MSRIVIIDSYVDHTQVKANSFEYINLCGDVCSKNITDRITHGTACAMVLDKCTSDYDLINIQVLPNFQKGYAKTFGTIQILIEAMDICLDMDIDIVSMSIGSSILSDSKKLYAKVEALSKKAVVVAALDNNWYLTASASYPFVIGVQCDWENCVDVGAIAYAYDNIMGTNVYANCSFEMLNQIGECPSNSLAVPVVAAQINEWINTEKQYSFKIFDKIKECNVYPKQKEAICKASDIKVVVNKILDSPDVPSVYIESPDASLCITIMNWLADNEKIESCAIVRTIDKYDIRTQTLNTALLLSEQIQYMKWFYKTDIVFIQDTTVTVSKKSELKYDVIIKHSENTACIMYDDEIEKVYIDDIARRLCEILFDEDVEILTTKADED